jgi:hypothetical protein
MEANKELVG